MTAVKKLEKKQIKTLNREFKALQRKEDRLMAAAMKARQPGWKKALEQKVPEKVYAGLNAAFAKGFSLVFRHGRKAIELTYKKDAITRRHTAGQEGFASSGRRKELKQLHRQAGNANASGQVDDQPAALPRHRGRQAAEGREARREGIAPCRR